jgi:hypothetical protein
MGDFRHSIGPPGCDSRDRGACRAKFGSHDESARTFSLSARAGNVCDRNSPDYPDHSGGALTNLLQNEVKPILNSTTDTVNTLKGTVKFLSNMYQNQ